MQHTISQLERAIAAGDTANELTANLSRHRVRAAAAAVNLDRRDVARRYAAAVDVEHLPVYQRIVACGYPAWSGRLGRNSPNPAQCR